MDLLKKLCSVHSPSGEEFRLRDFLISYINSNKNKWKYTPEIYFGDDFQDSLILVFGKPRLAAYSHMDSVGFTVRYSNDLVKIGTPRIENGVVLTGADSTGKIEGLLRTSETKENEEFLSIDFYRKIDRGTSLVFKNNFSESEEYINSAFLDNRLGIWVLLKLAETIENGALVFSCWEEHGGGSVSYLSRFLYNKYSIRQALIADITWITEGINFGEGVVISMRDRNIPRRLFIDKIISSASKSSIKYQLEVEDSGSSDGQYLQASDMPIDWCFIGAAEENAHGHNEKVHKADVYSMLNLYKILFNEL